MKFNETEWITVKDISVVWAEAQRPPNPREAKKIADEFDPDALGTITVTLPNGNGIYHCLDGQTRLAAVRALFGESQKVPCIVVNAKSPERAAKLFLKITNNRRALTALSRYLVGIAAKEEIPTAVCAILTKYDLSIGGSKNEGFVRSVGAFQTLYARFGGDALDDGIATLRRIWGRDPAAFDSHLIRGMVHFLCRHKHLDHERLVSFVGKTYTPIKLIAAARQARELQRKSMTDSVMFVLGAAYNLGLKADKRLSL